MLTIFICEDDPYYQNLLYDNIQGAVDWDTFDAELTKPTDDPEKIIKCIQERKYHGLYFLDIELGGGRSGIDVAEDIRQHDPRGFIVFVTSHNKYMNLTFEYKVEAMDYIYKTNNEKIFRKEIKKCIENAHKKHISRIEENCYIFKTLGGQTISCEYEDILLFQIDSSIANRVIVHTKRRQYTIYKSLDKISKELKSNTFYRCHKSCLLNTTNILRRDGAIVFNKEGKIIMQNGAECPVSVRYKSGLKVLANEIVRLR